MKSKSRLMASVTAMSLLIGAAIGFWITPYSVMVTLVPSSQTQNDGRMKSVAAKLGGMINEFAESHPGRLGSTPILPGFGYRRGHVQVVDEGAEFEVVWYGWNKSRLVEEGNELTRRLIDGLGRWETDAMERQRDQARSELAVIDGSLVKAQKELGRLQQQIGARDFDGELDSLRDNRAQIQIRIEAFRLELDSARLQITNHLQEIIRHHPTILSLRRNLNDALLRYTEAHPKVQELRASLARLETRLGDQGMQMDADILSQGESLAQDLYADVVKLRSEVVVLDGKIQLLHRAKDEIDSRMAVLSDHRLEFSRLRTRIDSLQAARTQSINNVEEQSLALASLSPPVLALAEAGGQGQVRSTPKWINAVLAALGLALLNGTIAYWGMRRGQFAMQSISSKAELAEATGLPILGELGHTVGMTSSAFENWAFDTLTTLKGRLGCAPNGALVCGFISSGPGEGRTTWIKAVARAARKRGLRVLTFHAGSSEESNLPAPGSGNRKPHSSPADADQMNLLAEIDRTLATGSEGTSLHVQSLQWIWNPENRRQWQDAMEKCQAMDNGVVLVELPAVSNRESVLLAEHVPNVVWLCGQGQNSVSQTRSEIEMLKCANVRLVGAVLNSPQP